MYMETEKVLVVPKLLMRGLVGDCACVKAFETLVQDYLKYYAVGNVIGKHVVPTYQDYVLIRDFDFDLFTANYRDFVKHVGYVNAGVLGDYICKTCKGIYFIPTCDEIISSFQVMETFYKRIR